MSVNFFLDNRVKPRSTTCLHRSLGPCHSRPTSLMEPFAPAQNGFCFFPGAVTTGQLCAGSQRWPCSNRLFLSGCSEPRHPGVKVLRATHTLSMAYSCPHRAPSGFSVITFVSFSSDLQGEASVLFFEVILGPRTKPE